MINELKNKEIAIGKEEDTCFLNKIDIYQDGTVPMFRDKFGTLWAISGHSHLGHIGMFKGTSVDDLTEAYPIKTNFSVGSSLKAFNNIKYPEGVNPRGSIWPFGLFIAKETNRFFVFFHNETGFNGDGTQYDSYGLCDTPKLDSDFRHVGLMHSDDEGRTWDFDRWVLTAETVCFTENFIPENINVKGQKIPHVSLGSGDFSLYIEPNGEFMYIFYNIIKADIEKEIWESCDTYIARSRIREDGVIGDFVKYYNGSFSEAGNFGKESIIVNNCWHSRVVYSEYLKCFIMTYTGVNSNSDVKNVLTDSVFFRTSFNMIDWSEPMELLRDGKRLGNHYNALVSITKTGYPNVIGKEFYLLSCHNGTDVKKTKIMLNDF